MISRILPKNDEFKKTLLIPEETHCIDSEIRYQKTNKKTKCKNDLELKSNISNDELHYSLFNAEENLRFNLNVQNFNNQ